MVEVYVEENMCFVVDLECVNLILLELVNVSIEIIEMVGGIIFIDGEGNVVKIDLVVVVIIFDVLDLL